MSLDCVSAGILVVDHLCAPIDHLPTAGELVMAERLPLALGGCAANVAIDLKRVDVSVGVAGCVGRDAMGRFFIDTLAAQGIDPGGIREVDAAETSGSLIINVAGEDRRFIHCSGANAVFQATDIPWELVRHAKVLYVGGYLLMPALESADGLVDALSLEKPRVRPRKRHHDARRRRARARRPLAQDGSRAGRDRCVSAQLRRGPADHVGLAGSLSSGRTISAPPERKPSFITLGHRGSFDLGRWTKAANGHVSD